VVRFGTVAVGCTVGGIWSVLWMDGVMSGGLAVGF
jgi:hypothetical protein